MSNQDIRRKLLKSITVGSGAVVTGKLVPNSWTKPVIDTVILPSHASTTDDSGSSPGGPCCLTEKYYCGKATQETTTVNGVGGYYIGIHVQPSGAVMVTVAPAGQQIICGKWEGSTTIACTGEEFTVTAYFDDAQCAPSEGSENLASAPIESIQVKGTIVCGATSASGTVTFGQQELSYTAYEDQCD